MQLLEASVLEARRPALLHAPFPHSRTPRPRSPIPQTPPPHTAQAHLRAFHDVLSALGLPDPAAAAPLLLPEGKALLVFLSASAAHGEQKLSLTARRPRPGDSAAAAALTALPSPPAK